MKCLNDPGPVRNGREFRILLQGKDERPHFAPCHVSTLVVLAMSRLRPFCFSCQEVKERGTRARMLLEDSSIVGIRSGPEDSERDRR